MVAVVTGFYCTLRSMTGQECVVPNATSVRFPGWRYSRHSWEGSWRPVHRTSLPCGRSTVGNLPPLSAHMTWNLEKRRRRRSRTRETWSDGAAQWTHSFPKGRPPAKFAGWERVDLLVSLGDQAMEIDPRNFRWNWPAVQDWITCIRKGTATQDFSTDEYGRMTMTLTLQHGPSRGRGWGGGGGGLEPPTFGQHGPYRFDFLRTYPIQRSKRSQKRDIFKISNAFPAI